MYDICRLQTTDCRFNDTKNILKRLSHQKFIIRVHIEILSLKSYVINCHKEMSSGGTNHAQFLMWEKQIIQSESPTTLFPHVRKEVCPIRKPQQSLSFTPSFLPFSLPKSHFSWEGVLHDKKKYLKISWSRSCLELHIIRVNRKIRQLNHTNEGCHLFTLFLGCCYKFTSEFESSTDVTKLCQNDSVKSTKPVTFSERLLSLFVRGL